MSRTPRFRVCVFLTHAEALRCPQKVLVQVCHFLMDASKKNKHRFNHQD